MSLLTTLAAPPSRASSPASYVSDMDAWLALLPTMVTEINGMNAADFFSVIGTVGQSGGVPTGAIFERGNNANGNYIKFAVGTMICWGGATGSTGGEAAVTFPAAFSASANMKIVTSAYSSTANVRSARATGRTTAGFNISVFDSGDARTAAAADWVAIGPWF